MGPLITVKKISIELVIRGALLSCGSLISMVITPIVVGAYLKKPSEK